MNKEDIEIIYTSIIYFITADIISFKSTKKLQRSNNYISEAGDLTNHQVFKFIIEGQLLYFEKYKDEFIISSNSISLLSILDGLINYNKLSLDETLNNIKNNLIKYFKNDEFKEKRNYNKYFIKYFINKNKINKYNTISDSTLATRSFIFGLFFNDLDKLLYITINSGKQTTNNCISILSGVSSALFSYFANNNINKFKWIYKLLDILKSKKLEKLLLENNIYKNEYKIDLDIFIYKIEKYISWRFDKNKKFIFKEEMIYPNIRIIEYFNRYSNNKNFFLPGSEGDDCIIIVYDCILSSLNYESLIIYSIMHVGDSNNIGSIASALFYIIQKKNSIEYNNLPFIVSNKIIKKLKNILIKFK